MLRINTKYIEQARAATTPEELHVLVQKAVELEHATIPTYLAAYYTLKLGTNGPVAQIIRSVVVEEMLHMSIAANLLIAIGGRPQIDKPHFIPKYPGPLPMDIGDGLIVPLEKCSISLIRDVFMKIEEPEHPIPIPVGLTDRQTEYGTIGEFYAAIDEKLRELGPRAFTGDFSTEMLDNTWFPRDQLFPIVDNKSASAGIRVIVRQGEGTRSSPIDPEDAPAHYYRFEQVVVGKRLVREPETRRYVFAGAPVALDERNVWNMQPNPNPDALPAGSLARRQSIQFAYAYTGLLRTLHETFNGDPGAIERAMGQMLQLRLLAQTVLSIPLPNSPDSTVSTGLSFRYQPTTEEHAG